MAVKMTAEMTAAEYRKKAKRLNRRDLEAEMELVIRALAQTPGRGYIAEYVREHRFHPRRKWQLDFAWPLLGTAVEVEGGKWVRGRHQRPQGFENDCVKYNHAQAAGFYVFRFTGDMVRDGRAYEFLDGVFPPF